jgi:hypothetical protein
MIVKKIAKKIVLLTAGCVFWLLVAGCPLTGGEDYSIDRSGGVDSQWQITDYDLQTYVPIPASNTKPITEVDRPDMYGTVTWMIPGGISLPPSFPGFVKDETYEAKIELNARYPYSFKSNKAFGYLTTQVDRVEGVNEGPQTRVLTVRYLPAEDAPPINFIDMSTLLSPPVAGQARQDSFAGGTFEGAIIWMIGTIPQTSDNYLPGAVYTAQITLKAAQGYTLNSPDGGGVKVHYNTGTMGTFRQSGDTIQGNVIFDATDSDVLSQFSGKNTEEESEECAISKIREAKGQERVSLQLVADTETVSFDADTHLGLEGLILIYGIDNEYGSPAEVTIDGGGKIVDLTGSNGADKPLITVGQGVTLTLRNITFKGLSPTEGDTITNSAPLVTVQDGGTFILDSNAVLTRNTIVDSSNMSPGVDVETGGTFLMNGGEISYMGESHATISWGSAVMVRDGGSFTMNNGTIRENWGSFGAIYIAGFFIMSNGTITANTFVDGGGLYINYSGQAIMSGGNIRGNNAMGTEAGPGGSGRGGGVYTTGEAVFNLIGGSISGNTASYYGGGVFATGTFSMNFGTITGNTAGMNGGGVYVDEGTFAMNLGDVNGNTVTGNESKGGGVFVKSGSTFNMFLGRIAANSIVPDDSSYEYEYDEEELKWGDGKGCGVYVEGGAIFRKTGGTIGGAIIENGNDEENPYVADDANTAQNYYRWPLKRIGEDGVFDDLSAIYPILKARGYAVYYAKEGNPPWTRTVTAGQDINLSTDDLMEPIKDEGEELVGHTTNWNEYPYGYKADNEEG